MSMALVSDIINRLRGVTPPPQTPEGATSVPVNPEVQVNPQTAQPEGAGTTLNPTGVEGSTSSNPTVAPDLGTEADTTSLPEAKTTISVDTEDATPAQEITVKTPMSTESEKSTPASVDKESVTIPSSPTASEAESQL